MSQQGVGCPHWQVSSIGGRTKKKSGTPTHTDPISTAIPSPSILVGSAPFVRKAKHFRKMYGGATRQCGPIVAAARVAIEDHFPKLKATHEMAAWLQSQLTALGAATVLPSETSMVSHESEGLKLTPPTLLTLYHHSSRPPQSLIDTTPLGFSCDEFNARLASLSPPIKAGAPRFVIHHQIDPDVVKTVVEVARQMKDEVAQTGTLKERSAGEDVAKGPRKVYK